MAILSAEVTESGEGEEVSETLQDCWALGVVKQAFGKVWKETLTKYVDFRIPCRREWWRMWEWQTLQGRRRGEHHGNIQGREESISEPRPSVLTAIVCFNSRAFRAELRGRP